MIHQPTKSNMTSNTEFQKLSPSYSSEQHTHADTLRPISEFSNISNSMASASVRKKEYTGGMKKTGMLNTMPQSTCVMLHASMQAFSELWGSQHWTTFAGQSCMDPHHLVQPIGVPASPLIPPVPYLVQVVEQLLHLRLRRGTLRHHVPEQKTRHKTDHY